MGALMPRQEFGHQNRWKPLSKLQTVSIAGAICVCIGTVLLLALPSQSATVTLHPSEVYQELTGWEALADVPDRPDAPYWADVGDLLLDRVVDEIGINRVRLGVRSGAETRSGTPSDFISGRIAYPRFKALSYKVENDNDDPFLIDPKGFDFAYLDWQIQNIVIPLQRRLAARGERLVINANYVAFKKGPSLHDDPEEYAEFVLATYLHMQQSFGFVPDLWEVILEPDLQPNNWDGAQIGKAMEAAGRRLDQAGFSPAFAAPSVTDMANAVPYATGIAGVPGASDHWSEFSYHRYRHNGRRNLDAIARFATQHQLKTSMLEWWFGKATAAVLREDLVYGNVSAFQGRTVTGFHTLKRSAAGVEIITKPDGRTTALYYLAGRLGWHRIGADSDAPKAFDAVGFAAPDGRLSVVIDAARGGAVSVAGLPQGSYLLRFVADGKAEVAPKTVELGTGSLQLEVPGTGIMSVVPVP